MKHQYFGDINDYRKYGLLRAIIDSTELRIFVAWMLTPDDGSRDGKFIDYLHDRNTWRRFDPPLFDVLKEAMHSDIPRHVRLIEKSNIIARSTYESSTVPDGAIERRQWFEELLEKATDSDLVFLDPDNSFEVKSRPYGRKASSKYVYWREVESLWQRGKSLLIYQHFIRKKKPAYTQRMLNDLQHSTPDSFVETFSTSNVLFLLALQPEHQCFHRPVVKLVRERWSGQIEHSARTQTQHEAT